MTPNELKALIAALVAALGWFVVREIMKKDRIGDDLKSFEEKVSRDIREVTEKFASELRSLADRNTMAIEGLNRSVSELAIALSEQKAFLAEHYVSKPEFKDAIEVIHKRVTKHSIKLEELGPCTREGCPLRPTCEGIDG